MLSNKEKNTLLISNIIAIVISLIVCVPFGKTSVTSFELIAKFIVAPILIAVLVGITTYTKYNNFQPANKFIFVSAYTPFFSYVGASLFSTLLALIRTTNGYSHYYQWLLTLIVLVTAFVLVAIVNHMIHRWILVFTKNELMIVDTVLLILAIFLTFVLHNTVSNHVGAVLQAESILYIIVPLVFGLLFAAFHVLRIMYLHSSKESFKMVSHKELVANWKAEREKIYSEAEVDILYGLYSFSKNELGLSDELDDLYEEIIEELESQDEEPAAEEEKPEEPVKEEAAPEEVVEEKPVEEPVKVEPVPEEVIEEKPATEQPIVEEPVPLVVKPEPVVVKRVVEVINEVELELIQKEQKALQEERQKLEEMQKAKLEQLMEVEKELAQVEEKLAAAAAKERKPKTPPVVKDIKPSFEEVLNYVRAIPDITEKANATQTSYRFMIGNKPFLMMQNSPKDYKITFLYELDEIVDLIVNTPNVVKAKSPKGDNWFKLTNKGDYTEDQIFDVVDKSHRMLEILEERKLQAKEQARLAKLEAKIREREAIRLEKEKAREAERMRKQKEREAEKLRIQREKEKERQKILAQKEKEKARLKAQREKEREKARLKAQKEREAAKLKAQKEKEREAERLRKQKEKEEAKLKAQAEKAEKKAQEDAAKKAAQEPGSSTPKEAA